MSGSFSSPLTHLDSLSWPKAKRMGWDSNSVVDPREINTFSNDAVQNPVQLDPQAVASKQIVENTIDDELSLLIAVWPSLRPQTRTAIARLAKLVDRERKTYRLPKGKEAIEP